MSEFVKIARIDEIPVNGSKVSRIGFYTELSDLKYPSQTGITITLKVESAPSAIKENQAPLEIESVSSFSSLPGSFKTYDDLSEPINLKIIKTTKKDNKESLDVDILKVRIRYWQNSNRGVNILAFALTDKGTKTPFSSAATPLDTYTQGLGVMETQFCPYGPSPAIIKKIQIEMEDIQRDKVIYILKKEVDIEWSEAKRSVNNDQ